MSSATVVVEKSSVMNGSTSSSSSKLNELYSNYQTESPSSPSSTDSSPNSNSSTSSSRSSSVTSEGVHLPARTSVSSVDSSLARHPTNKINSSNSDPSSSSSNHYRKQSCSSSSSSSSIKLPYPILADHRDLSSILVVLQKETQTTSKKIDDVTEQIDDRERRLTSNLPMHIKNLLKSERIKLKQKLDALKKHERRVSLQIDFVTTKTEIKGLEDEQQPHILTTNGNDECEQIKILLGKLRQKLDKMKVYMRARNEQMKKLNNGKQQSTNSSNGTRKTLSSSQKQRPSSSSAGKDPNHKRLPPSSMSHANKRLKSTHNNHNTPPIVRLASRITSHTSKSHSESMPPPMPTVRFVNKTTDSSFAAINSSSPATPASSSSTLSPPLIATTSTGEAPSSSMKNLPQKTKVPLDDDDDEEELNLDLDVDELFKEDNDSSSQETLKRSNSHRN